MSKDEILNKLLNYHKSKNFNKNDLFWIYTNRILNKSLDEIKRNNPEVIIVDPIDKLFDSKKSINFVGGLHLNYSGHQIVAQEILKSIKPFSFELVLLIECIGRPTFPCFPVIPALTRVVGGAS